MAEFIDGDTEIAYTVGHSTHSLERLGAILQANGVRQIADVRRMPRSRRMPHFNVESLAHSLPEAGIDLAAITAKLVEDGISAFETDLAKLLSVIEEKEE